MNILLITRYLSAKVGGGQYVFSLIAKLLAENGHRVWIISNHIDLEKLEHENIRIIQVSNKTITKINSNPFEIIKYFVLVTRAGYNIIKKEKIDIIHTNQTFMSTAAVAGSFLSLLTSIPHIFLIHHVASAHKGYWKDWSKQKGNSRIGGFLASLSDKLMPRVKCSAIHTVSEATRDYLQKLGIKKPIYVIHNAIPINPVQNSETNALQFIDISGLSFHKNIQTAIRALPLVKKSFPNVSLIIVGEGPYRKNLEKLVVELDLKNNVIFKGRIPDDEKNMLLKTSEALVFPSLMEGFGLVILEAFAQKKPALVSKIRPMSEIVEHNKTGMVLSPHNEKDWAEAMEYLILNPQVGSKMGEAARKLIEEKYDLNKMYEKILEMYNEVISGTK